MFNTLKPKTGDAYVFDFDAAKKRCRMVMIDDDMTAKALVDGLMAEGYNIFQCYKIEPGVVAQCETGTFDIVALDHAALGLYDKIRNSNPVQYLIALAAQPDHPAVAKYFQSANGRLKKPFDVAALKTVLDTGIKALFDRNQLLAQMSDLLLKAKVDKKIVDGVVDSLKKEVPSTIGALGKQVREAIKPAPLTTELNFVLWQLVKIRE
jgi:AmiR/NasT family two-component response regulator